MLTILKIGRESIMQAMQQLVANKLRTFLSLLGISIGIFSIIGVLAAVDSLEDNVRGSLEKMGNDVIYVSKWPWANMSNDWWKYMKRPEPKHADYEAIKDKVDQAELTCFSVRLGRKTLKRQSTTVNNAFLLGVSLEYAELFGVEFEKGRYFSTLEYHGGANKIILGNDIATGLFGTIEPIGRKVKMMGKKYEVIGVLEKSGDDLLNIADFDEAILVSYPHATTLANLKSSRNYGTMIGVKAKEGIALVDLKDEVKGVIRASHHLKPRAEDNFSLNQMSLIVAVFDNIFTGLNVLGFVIGIFSFLIGGVSVANIMFVSVKERTSMIGVKKALGAKRRIILLEFLIESVILCILGGVMGLLLVQIITMILSAVMDFHLYLDFGNILLGVGASVFIGVISGFIPALQASRMDPVEAMRK